MLKVTDLVDEVAAVNGNRRRRILDKSNIETFVELVNEHQNNQDIHTIRVYSSEGFVANSYKYRADISYLQAERQEDGTFRAYASTCDAKRGHGNGSLVIINGRAA